ncbi:hypothetical protein [Rossellomorea aquimaris]|uniref:hypothetical protein n=1 Tax=Rossellomorea aquimaris TaxID=189382 RepID=UPI0007D077E2|nr:hypothetical protein [Rossellomorea aquimaris]
MTLLMEYKWLILLISETLAWVATIYMAYARYWLESKLQVIISGAIAVITGYIPHVLLGILDYLEHGKLQIFTLCVILLLIFGITICNKYLIIIDKSIKVWLKRKREIQ